jgi:transcriptional regulator with XRE-family HTH domain
MEERLELILQHYKLSASRLADLLDVQRSGISHILSGRNKPSFDFLVRLLSHFPELDANWLLNGKGSMLRAESDAIPAESSLFDDSREEVTKSTGKPPNDTPETSMNIEKENVYKSKQPATAEGKDVESVMILYTDGTFRKYKQE